MSQSAHKPARRYCFTLNNPTRAEARALDLLGQRITNNDPANRLKYLVVGVERGGRAQTLHYQGFAIFNRPIRFNAAKNYISARCHLEATKGTSTQAADYCKKDGEYSEFGDIPKDAGKRTDLNEFTEWCKSLDYQPTDQEVAATFPVLWIKYSERLRNFIDLVCPKPPLITSAPRGWQEGLAEVLAQPPHPRMIDFIVDHRGNEGKTWMTKWILSNYPSKAQALPVGKEADIGLMVDETKSIFIIDVKRSKMEFLNYSVLESLKDQMIASPKYMSRMKFINTLPHVIVFCNENPDDTKLSEDRYRITYLN